MTHTRQLINYQQWRCLAALQDSPSSQSAFVHRLRSSSILFVQSCNVKVKVRPRHIASLTISLSEHFWSSCALNIPQTTTGHNNDMEGNTAENSGSTLDRSEDEIALQGCCSPKKAPYRFLGLALMCLLGFGTNWCNFTDAWFTCRTRHPSLSVATLSE